MAWSSQPEPTLRIVTELAANSEFIARRATYLDIGANHPTKDSQTWPLYRGGWRGVAVEPLKILRDHNRARVTDDNDVKTLWRTHRPDDVLVQEAIGATPGELSLYMSGRLGGLTSYDPAWHLNAYDRYSHDQRRIIVPMTTIDALCRRYQETLSRCEFVTIDVEGYENEILDGWSEVFRPRYVVIESYDRRTKRFDQDLIDRMKTRYDLIETVKVNTIWRRRDQ